MTLQLLSIDARLTVKAHCKGLFLMGNGAVDPQLAADRRRPRPAHHARSTDPKEILFRFNAIRHRWQGNSNARDRSIASIGYG